MLYHIMLHYVTREKSHGKGPRARRHETHIGNRDIK